MNEVLLSILRDRNTGLAEFRRASDQLAHLLCAATITRLSGESRAIETPVGSTTGFAMPSDILLVPIVRAALALLPAFTQLIPSAPVAFVGIQREETTAEAQFYYKKFPHRRSQRAVILDPMLATGGSATLAAGLLMNEGYAPQDIYFTGVVAAREGIERLATVIPRDNIVVAATDPALNDQKYIVPGLGDYGDRYFGT
jgi:uracil phosphoribosyltransferase